MHIYSMITMYSELSHKLSLDLSKTEASTPQHQCQIKLRKQQQQQNKVTLLFVLQIVSLVFIEWSSSCNVELRGMMVLTEGKYFGKCVKYSAKNIFTAKSTRGHEVGMAG